jgi:hypothetical protein
MRRWLLCAVGVASPVAAQDGTIRFQPGIEARARYEGLRDDAWGSADSPDDNYLWVRLMPQAEVQAGPVRGFVEGIAAYRLATQARKGPADETGIDVLQAYAELSLPAGPAMVTLRGGRALMSLGAERLVGRRYGPNVPQPFDGLQAGATFGAFRAALFRLRPVAIGLGDFDDRASNTRRLSGIYATIGRNTGGIDLYWLDHARDDVRFAQGSGRERRQTYGARLFGDRGRWSWNWEAMLQRGRFAGAPIHAWSLASETGYRRGRTTIRLRANVASGDADRRDPVLQTFNALFPKGKYFGELSPVGPYNIVNLHPGVETDIGGDFTLGLAGVAYWRHRRGDGVYSVPGNLLRPGDERAPRHIGNQAEAVLAWQAGPFSLSASYSVFVPGGFIRATGPSRAIHMLGLEALFSR